jgi:uncharacterized protein (TIGR02145 family)
MNKLLFYVCIALAIFGCSGDMNDLPGLGGERKCGDILYNATDSNMRCQNDVVERRCGETWYDTADENIICAYLYDSDKNKEYEVVLTRCGTREYSNPYEDLNNNPQNYFDASAQFCLDNAVYYKCGGREYDASTQYCSGNALSTYDSVKYSGQSYKTVAIGKQTWMAENLNYNPGTGNSACYNNDPANCAKYGRLYNWATAMGLQSSCNSNFCGIAALQGIRGICPEGWHIPSNGDWDVLFRYVDGTSGTESPYSSETAGGGLKTASGWDYYSNNVSGNGTNSYGFSALPGGYRSGSFSYVGTSGYWWGASEIYSEYHYYDATAYYRYMTYSSGKADASTGDKSYFASVRCIQDKCGDIDYNPATQFCHSDGQTYSCGNKPLYPVAQFCFDGEVHDKCDGQTYDPSTQRCYGSVIQTRCGTGNSYFNSSTHFCIGNTVHEKCNGQTYDPSEYFCDGGALHSTCNGQSYDISTQRCNNVGVIETRCGSTGNTYYVSSTHFCHGTSVYEKCGGVYTYDPDMYFCSGNSYYQKCGGESYNISTEFCYDNSVYGKCNSQEYDPSTQRCNGTVIETRCGTGSSYYNPSTDFCSGTTVYEKCGGYYGTYEPSTHFCLDNSITLLCGGETYTSSQFCSDYDGEVHDKCNDYTYNTSTNFCHDNMLYNKCNGNIYNPSTEYCSGAGVKPYTGFIEYQGQTYKTIVIGTQTWFAENLNYNTGNSDCIYNDPNCTKYGRFYNWATAMNIDASYNNSQWNGSNQNHQGICPSGWHIPNNADWDVLLHYVDGTNGVESPYNSSTASTDLKATSSWNSCGLSGSLYRCEDTHGFSALGADLNYGIGSRSRWWSSTEDGTVNVYGLQLAYDVGQTYNSSESKSILKSVRCLQND